MPPSKVCVESAPVQAESEEGMPVDLSASVLNAMAMISKQAWLVAPPSVPTSSSADDSTACAA